MSRKLRTTKLIKPALQLRLTSIFLITACAALLVQFVVLNRLLVLLARRLPEQADILMEEWPSLLATTLGLSVALVLPFTLGVGILATFQVAGPIHRFETYFRALLRGEDPGPCRIRRGDHLQDFCELLNQVVAPLRASASSAAPHQDEHDLEAVDSLAGREPVVRNKGR